MTIRKLKNKTSDVRDIIENVASGLIWIFVIYSIFTGNPIRAIVSLLPIVGKWRR